MNGPRDHALGLLQKAGNDLIAGNATIATGEALDVAARVHRLAEGIIRGQDPPQGE